MSDQANPAGQVVVLDNLRSAHNVGTILRTAEGLGWRTVYLCGTTPAPPLPGDPRPPYAQDRAAREIAKTALGAETHLRLRYAADTADALGALRTAGYRIVALEQAPGAVSLEECPPDTLTALVVGNEVTGIAAGILGRCNMVTQIPMLGHKESFNVAVAAGIAMYHLSLHSE